MTTSPNVFKPIENPRIRFIIIFSIILATMMQTLDSTIANVALPRIQGSLSGTQDQVAWILTSYIIAAAITIPLTGWMAGVFGQKRILLFSVTGFIITSVLCGIATQLPEMIFFRFLQGVCGAALIPTSQAVLLNITAKENYGKAMAIWGFGVTMGPILGPLLGGFLTENYNWRWVFFINIPIGAVAFLGLYFFLPEGKTEKSKFDFFGFITLSLSVASFQMMLDRGNLLDWFQSKEIIAEALLSVISLYLFIVHTLTHSKPFLNFALFKNRNFTIASVLIFTLGVALFSTLALVPTMLQSLLNYPIVTAGMITASQGTGTLLAMMSVSHLLKRFDARYIIFLGISLIAFSLWRMTFYSLWMDSWTLIMPGMAQGFGAGLCYISLSTVAFSTLPRELQNEGTSFFNLMRNVGSSVGISIVEACLTRGIRSAHAILGEHISEYNTLANTSKTLALLNANILRQATMIAYINDFHLIMLAAITVLPLIFFIKKITAPSATHGGLE